MSRHYDTESFRYIHIHYSATRLSERCFINKKMRRVRINSEVNQLPRPRTSLPSQPSVYQLSRNPGPRTLPNDNNSNPAFGREKTVLPFCRFVIVPDQIQISPATAKDTNPSNTYCVKAL